MLIDDRSSCVALPELPLLGVLPGTGGLTRVVDKRFVRRDRADWFATRSEGLGGRKAVEWKLIDEAVPRQKGDETVAGRAAELAGKSKRAGERGVELTPLAKERTDGAIRYSHVEATLDHEARTVTITVHGPDSGAPATLDEIHGQ